MKLSAFQKFLGGLAGIAALAFVWLLLWSDYHAYSSRDGIIGNVGATEDTTQDAMAFARLEEARRRLETPLATLLATDENERL